MIDYKAKVVIATHKKYQMPSDPLYFPLHVGAEGKKGADGSNLDLGYVKDNTGDNISILNPSFCELTGLYWACRNLDNDYIGLVHYRRHFSMKNKKGFENVLTYSELKPYLGKIKVFVPKKRKYYIETLYSHYAHTHYSSQLDETRKIILEKYPDYISSYDKVIKHTYGYMFNMMIMDKNYLNDYCTWLFDILFELSQRVIMSELSAFQGRCYGRISEIIFNVWIDYKIETGNLKENQIKELPFIYMEKIDWEKKGMCFLKAKFFGKRYERSF